MYQMNIKKLFIVAMFCLAACNGKETAVSNQVQLNFMMQVGTESLQLNSTKYSNANGDIYTIEKFAFYISNVILRNKAKNISYTEPISYHLVRIENTNTVSISIPAVIANNYDELQFSIGVDSKANASIDKLGDLDPANGMAWDWNTGYKFLSLEGRYFPTNAPAKGLLMHIGENENYKTITLSLNKPIEVATGKTSTITIQTDIAQLFKSPNLINFANTNQVMGGEDAKKIAQNYTTMFRVSN